MDKFPWRRLPKMLWLWIAHGFGSIPWSIAGLWRVWQLRKLTSNDFDQMVRYYPHFLPWVNPEDWTGGVRGFPLEYKCIPPDLHDKYPPTDWGFWRYHALRNPAGGLRNYPWWVCRLNKDEIRHRPSYVPQHVKAWYLRRLDEVDRITWFVCWQGDYLHMRCVILWSDNWHGELGIGFRIFPRDRQGPWPDSTRWKIGAQFASKFHILKRG